MSSISRKPRTLVKSKYFTRTVMDDSSDGFRESKKINLGPKISKPKSKKKVRKIKGQTDIRKIISRPNNLVSHSEDFNKVCIEAGINVDVEYLQLAVAMSESMPATLDQASTQERRTKIRATLIEYGFHVPAIKIDKEVKKRLRKRYSKVKSESRLLHTTGEERQQIISDRYCQVLMESNKCNTKDINIKPSNSSEKYNLGTNTAYYEMSNDRYFIKGILEKTDSKVDSLLRDWSEIPGRPKSPTRIEHLDLQFTDVVYTQEELDVILSGKFLDMKKIVRCKQNFNKTIGDNTDADGTSLRSVDKVPIEMQRCISPDIFDDELSLMENNGSINKLNLTKSQELPKINTTLYKLPLSQPNLYCTGTDNDFMDMTECLTTNISQSKENLTNQSKANTILSQNSTNNTRRRSDDFMDLTECVKSASQKLEVIDEIDLTQAVEGSMDLTQSSDSSDSTLPCIYIDGYIPNKKDDQSSGSLFDDYDYQHSDESVKSSKIDDIDTSPEDIFVTQEDTIFEDDDNHKTKISITKEPFKEFLNDGPCFNESKDKNSNYNSSMTNESNLDDFQINNPDSSEINTKIRGNDENNDLHQELHEKSSNKEASFIQTSNCTTNYEEIKIDKQINENLNHDEVDLIQDLHEKSDDNTVGSDNYSINDENLETDQETSEHLNCVEIDLTQDIHEESTDEETNFTKNDKYSIDFEEIETDKHTNENLHYDEVDLTQDTDEKSNDSIIGSDNHPMNGENEIETDKQTNENLNYDKVDLTQDTDETPVNTEVSHIGNANSSVGYSEVHGNMKEYNDKTNENFSQSSSQCTVFEISDEELDYSVNKSRNFQDNVNYESDDSLPAVQIEGTRVKIKPQSCTPIKNAVAESPNNSVEYCGNVGNSIKSAETANLRNNKSLKETLIKEILQETLQSMEKRIKTPIKKTENNCENKKQQNVTPIKTALQESAIVAETPTNSRYIVKTTNVTPMLDYEAMTSPERNMELNKYGIKPIKRKRAIQLLEHIYNQTHPIVEDNIEVEAKRIKTSKDQTKKDMTEDNFVDVNMDTEVNIYNVTSERPVLKEIHCDPTDWALPKKGRAKIHTCPTPLHIVLHNYISSRVKLKEAILCYKPINIDIIHKQLVDYGYKFDSKELLRFFDKKCITVKTSNNDNRNKKSPRKVMR